MPFTRGGVVPGLTVPPAARRESTMRCDTILLMGVGKLSVCVGLSLLFLQEIKREAPVSNSKKNPGKVLVFFMIGAVLCCCK